MRPLDALAFGGEGLISEVIKKTTGCNGSHIASVLSCATIEGVSFVQVAESTSLGDGFAGVQINRMSDHIRDYEGEIWWLPLKKELRAELDVISVVNYLLAERGKPYDAPQAVMSRLDDLALIPENDEDLTKLFCSEYYTQACKVGFFNTRYENLLVKQFADINPSTQTPADCFNFGIYDEPHQIKGELKELF